MRDQELERSVSQPAHPAFLSPALILALLLLLATALSGCASRGGSIPYDVAEFGAPDPISQTALQDDYTIAPLDQLAIQVFQVNDLSGNYQVDLTGRITLPFIGSVRVVDLTADQLANELERRFAEQGYLKNPEIGVGVAESRGSVLTVEGSVKKPGVYPVIGRTTLIQAVAQAGGIDEFGNPKRVAIFRQIDGQRMAAAFDITSIRAGEAPDPEVFRGDIIVIDGNNVRRAWRDTIQSFPLFQVFSPL
ncbi:MAG: polysaccharide biosynthesis/export family protein [Erythrobacter sp.]|jgi:polysaccharide export outer membrane protein|nr:polysaccharide biosynthesis/export family protein [Erythrobacter sp.]